MVLYHNLDGATHFFILFASLVVQLQGFLDSNISTYGGILYCLYCGSKVYGLPGDLLTEGIVCVCDDSLPHELIHDDISVPDLDLDTLGGFVSVENNREVELRVERVLHWLRSQLGSLTFDEDVGVGPAYQVLLQEARG